MDVHQIELKALLCKVHCGPCVCLEIGTKDARNSKDFRMKRRRSEVQK